MSTILTIPTMSLSKTEKLSWLEVCTAKICDFIKSARQSVEGGSPFEIGTIVKRLYPYPFSNFCSLKQKRHSLQSPKKVSKK